MVAPDERGAGPPSSHTTLVLLVGGPLERVGVRSMCDRARALADDAHADLIVCDLGQSGANAGTVDVVARLKVLAGSEGRHVRFVHASPELGDLLRFIGLEDVVTLEPT